MSSAALPPFMIGLSGEADSPKAIGSPKTSSKRFSFSLSTSYKEAENTDYDDTEGISLSSKLSSPKRMFGKGGIIGSNGTASTGSTGNSSMTVSDSNVLDREDEVQRVSHIGGANTFRKDVGSLQLTANNTEDIARGVSFSAFTRVKHICDGSNSNLFRCTWEDREVIVKRLKIDKISVQHVFSEFEFESEFLRRSAECPQLVRIFAYGLDLVSEFDLPEDVRVDPSSQLVVINPDNGERTVQVPFVVLETLTGGSLGFYLRRHQNNYHKRPYKLGRVFTILKQLAQALTYIHEGFHKDYCVIHRDLKPDNVVFDSEDNLRLIDFGLSICVKKISYATEVFEMTGGTGSLRYMAPEVASFQPYNDRSDIYSFGIIAYEVLTGVAPYGAMNRAKFVKRVIENHERPSVDVDDYGRRIRAPLEVKDLITRCWDFDHTKRPCASEVLAICEQLYEAQVVADAQGSGGCGCS